MLMPNVLALLKKMTNKVIMIMDWTNSGFSLQFLWLISNHSKLWIWFKPWIKSVRQSWNFCLTLRSWFGSGFKEKLANSVHMDIWFSRSFAWEWIKHTLNRFHKQSLFQTKFTTDHWIQYDWHLSMGFYSLVMIVIFLDV